jgi:hypothetical protein
MLHKPRTAVQNSEFYGLIMQAKFDDDQKDALVMAVSQNRTKKSSELSVEEMQVAINKIKKTVNDTAHKQRARIVAVARDIGYVDGGNYSKLNAFVLKHFKVATIFEVPHSELTKVITGIEQVRKWEQKKALEAQFV